MLFYIRAALFACLANEYNDNGVCSTSCTSTSGQYYVGVSEKICTNCSNSTVFNGVYEVVGLMKRCTTCDGPGERIHGLVCDKTPCFNRFATSTQEQPFTDRNRCKSTCDGYVEDPHMLECVAECSTPYFVESAVNTSQRTPVGTTVTQVLVQSISIRWCTTKCPESRPYLLSFQTIQKCVAVCPDGLYLDDKICKGSCSSLTYRAVDGNKLCVTGCDGYYRQQSQYRECVDSCPDYIEPGQLECKATCEKGHFFGVNPKQCVEKCPWNFPVLVSLAAGASGGAALYQCNSQCQQPTPLQETQGLETACVKTCSGSRKNQAGICVDKCSAGYAESGTLCSASCVYNVSVVGNVEICVDDYNTQSVSNDTQYEQVDIYGRIRLVSSCPRGEYQRVASGRRRCGFCRSYYVQGANGTKECVAQCPLYSYGMQCVSAAAGEGFDVLNINNQFKDFCADGSFLAQSGSAGTKTCIRVCDSGQFTVTSLGQKACIASCGKYLTAENSAGSRLCGDACGLGLYQNAEDKTCLSTCASSRFYNSSGMLECVTSCPYYQAVNGSASKCFRYGCAQSLTSNLEIKQDGGILCVQKCTAALPLLQGSTCVSACDTRFYSVDIDGQPHCETRCPGNYTGVDVNGVRHWECVRGCGDSLFFLAVANGAGECISECPASYPYQSGRACVQKCPGLFFVQGTSGLECVSSCNSSYPREQRVEAQIQCGPPCAQGMFESVVDQSCLASCGKLFQMGGKCIQTCPTETMYQRFSTQYQHWECLFGCTAQFNFQSGVRVCAVCTAQQPIRRQYYDTTIPQQECVSACLSTEYTMTAMDTSFCVTACPAGTYLSGRQCLTSCTAGRIPVNGQCEEAKNRSSGWAVGVFIAALVFLGCGALIPTVFFLRKKQGVQNARMRRIREVQIRAHGAGNALTM